MKERKSTLGDRIESENNGFLAFKSKEAAFKYLDNIYGNSVKKEKSKKSGKNK